MDVHFMKAFTLSMMIPFRLEIETFHTISIRTTGNPLLNKRSRPHLCVSIEIFN